MNISHEVCMSLESFTFNFKIIKDDVDHVFNCLVDLGNQSFYLSSNLLGCDGKGFTFRGYEIKTFLGFCSQKFERC